MSTETWLTGSSCLFDVIKLYNSEVHVWYYCVLVINYHSNVYLPSSNYIIYVLHILY